MAVGPFALVESWVTGGTTVAMLLYVCGSHSGEGLVFVRSVANFESLGAIFWVAILTFAVGQDVILYGRRGDKYAEIRLLAKCDIDYKLCPCSHFRPR